MVLNSRQEPLPSNLKLSQEWTFHKIDFKIGKGASGQIRLMYLVNFNESVIELMWIYSHEQFKPDEKELKNVIESILEN